MRSMMVRNISGSALSATAQYPHDLVLARMAFRRTPAARQHRQDFGLAPVIVPEPTTPLVPDEGGFVFEAPGCSQTWICLDSDGNVAQQNSDRASSMARSRTGSAARSSMLIIGK